MAVIHWSQTVHHDGSPSYVSFDPTGSHASIRLRLRVSKTAPITQLFVRTIPDGEQHFAPMQIVASNAQCNWWEAEIRLHMLRTNYRFFFQTTEGNWSFTANGVVQYTPTDATDFKFLYRYHAPSWVQDSVFYQIFPERFADGDSSNNVQSGAYACYGTPVVAHSWGEVPTQTGAAGNAHFFGGDLQGIVQHMDYLTDLGVSALYLTPIFTSPSNHKYDVENYREVDRHFGGEKALIALREALDKRDMRLMLDIVPNHCSSMHAWFLAAQKDVRAPTCEYFTFGTTSNTYESWLGVSSLPKLNYHSEHLRNEMYAGENAIMRYWLRPPYRIDGWRIDVANMLARQGESQLEHKIGRGIRRAVKAESPSMYLIGEHFFDGSAQLQGDELDATMNYRGFSLPLLQWLVGYINDLSLNLPRETWPLLPTEALMAQWRAFLSAIPWQIAIQQFNLLGSHDTARLQTVLNGDEALIQVAVTLLFTYPGVPSVYYGDEIGLEGGRDPDNRHCMSWDPHTWNMTRRALYQHLIHERRTAPALREGGFQALYAAGETLAFLREAPDERLLIVARRKDDGLKALSLQQAGLADGTRVNELLSGTHEVVTGGMLSLDSLPPVGAQIWRIQAEQ
ncbi:MAG: maltodextrin glucosidase [Ktedonobacteraceae bacterium]